MRHASPTTTEQLPVASQVRAWVGAASPGAVLDARTAPGAPSNAARVALSRLANEMFPPIVFVRRHIYWKHDLGDGAMHPVGVGSGLVPAALYVAGSGSGLAGYSAARMFGWTSQMLVAPEIAVVGRPPRGFEEHITFHSRKNTLRRLLNPQEVALLEATVGYIHTEGYDIEYRSGHGFLCDWETHDESDCYWQWTDAVDAFARRCLRDVDSEWSFNEQQLLNVAANERMGGRELRQKMADLADAISEHRKQGNLTA